MKTMKIRFASFSRSWMAPKHFAFAMPSTKIKETYKKTHML